MTLGEYINQLKKESEQRYKQQIQPLVNAFDELYKAKQREKADIGMISLVGEKYGLPSNVNVNDPVSLKTFRKEIIKTYGSVDNWAKYYETHKVKSFYDKQSGVESPSLLESKENFNKVSELKQLYNKLPAAVREQYSESDLTAKNYDELKRKFNDSISTYNIQVDENKSRKAILNKMTPSEFNWISERTGKKLSELSSVDLNMYHNQYTELNKDKKVNKKEIKDALSKMSTSEFKEFKQLYPNADDPVLINMFHNEYIKDKTTAKEKLGVLSKLKDRYLLYEALNEIERRKKINKPMTLEELNVYVNELNNPKKRETGAKYSTVKKIIMDNATGEISITHNDGSIETISNTLSDGRKLTPLNVKVEQKKGKNIYYVDDKRVKDKDKQTVEKYYMAKVMAEDIAKNSPDKFGKPTVATPKNAIKTAIKYVPPVVINQLGKYIDNKDLQKKFKKAAKKGDVNSQVNILLSSDKYPREMIKIIADKVIQKYNKEKDVKKKKLLKNIGELLYYYMGERIDLEDTEEVLPKQKQQNETQQKQKPKKSNGGSKPMNAAVPIDS